MAPMRSRLIRFVVLLLVGVLPLRAAAAALPVLCLEGHAQAASEANDPGDHEEHGAAQPHPEGPAGDANQLNHDCGFCAKHCHGASFVLASDRPSVLVRPTVDAVPFDAWRNAGFVPDHLDRPPLAL